MILTIYHHDSVHKFPQLYSRYVYNVDEKGWLNVYKRDPITGDETLRATFTRFDYFLIEEA